MGRWSVKWLKEIKVYNWSYLVKDKLRSMNQCGGGGGWERERAKGLQCQQQKKPVVWNTLKYVSHVEYGAVQPCRNSSVLPRKLLLPFPVCLENGGSRLFLIRWRILLLRRRHFLRHSCGISCPASNVLFMSMGHIILVSHRAQHRFNVSGIVGT